MSANEVHRDIGASKKATSHIKRACFGLIKASSRPKKFNPEKALVSALLQAGLGFTPHDRIAVLVGTEEATVRLNMRHINGGIPVASSPLSPENFWYVLKKGGDERQFVAIMGSCESMIFHDLCTVKSFLSLYPGLWSKITDAAKLTTKAGFSPFLNRPLVETKSGRILEVEFGTFGKAHIEKMNKAVEAGDVAFLGQIGRALETRGWALGALALPSLSSLGLFHSTYRTSSGGESLSGLDEIIELLLEFLANHEAALSRLQVWVVCSSPLLSGALVERVVSKNRMSWEQVIFPSLFCGAHQEACYLLYLSTAPRPSLMIGIESLYSGRFAYFPEGSS